MADTLEPPSVPIDEGALEAAQQASEDPLREPLLPVAGGPAPGLLLLPGARLVDPAPDPQQLAAPRANLVASTVVLAKTIIGAGAAALPYAVARLGGLTAVAFLVAIAAMTHFSVAALTLGTLATGHASYPAVVQALLGPRAAAALDVALVLRCAGLIVVYLVLATDILAGGAGLPGLLCDLAGARGAGWCGRRRGVAAALAVGVLGPLVAPRRLAAARLSSAVGLGAAGAWAVVTVGLAGVAAASGAAHPLPWLPDARTLGGGSWGEQAVNLLATLPVIATAYTCQMTVHVIARDLEPFSQRRMRAVSAGAVTICTVFFLAVGIGSYVAFGADVPADVLEEFSESRLQHLVGGATARALGLLVRLGFLLSVLANVPMQMLPYRESLARLLLGGGELGGGGYYALTFGSVALFYFVAASARSIWVPLQLVGATAGALIAFFFPAAVALRAWAATAGEGPGGAGGGGARYWRGNAWVLVGIGAVQVVTGVGAVLLNNNGRHPHAHAA